MIVIIKDSDFITNKIPTNRKHSAFKMWADRDHKLCARDLDASTWFVHMFLSGTVLELTKPEVLGLSAKRLSCEQQKKQD